MTFIQEAAPAPPQTRKHVPAPANPPRPNRVARERQCFTNYRSAFKPQIDVTSQPSVNPLAAVPARPLPSNEKAQANRHPACWPMTGGPGRREVLTI
jgi:hypothetical protein